MTLVLQKRQVNNKYEDAIGGKHWCNEYEQNSQEIIELPFTPIERLRVAFPNIEDRVLFASYCRLYKLLLIIVKVTLKLLRVAFRERCL